MSKAASTFRQIDLTRALRAARAAGLSVLRYEIDPVTGKIVVVAAIPEAASPRDEFEQWQARHAH